MNPDLAEHQLDRTEEAPREARCCLAAHRR